MRHFLSTAILVGSLAGHVYGHRQPVSSPHDQAPVRRKTLGFGPRHPHAVYHSTPYTIQTNGFTPQDPYMEPISIARVFIDDVLSTSSAEGLSYKIRDDSYTDKSTGVTHVYVRQLVNGLEVADGDMNINIKDGMVISYGNSFFKGVAPAAGFGHPVNFSKLQDVRVEACKDAHSLTAPTWNQDGQTVLGSAQEPIPAEFLKTLDNNCRTAFSAPEFSTDDPADVRSALLQFMHTATPNAKLAADIENKFEEYAEKLVVAPVHHLTSNDNEMHVEFSIDSVPDAVNPVKARLAYIQVPNAAGDATELQLVWKFEVEMEDNWYDAAVTAHAPHKIVSVVDWAADSAPIPAPENVPATYNVFAWGVNDPSVGERSLEKEPYDTLASPAGWHAIPYAHDPQSTNIRRKGGDFWRNTTTTWGNNVFAQENWEGANNFVSNYRPDAGKSKVFDYPYDPKLTDKADGLEEAKKYINTTVAQLFYTTNRVHDLFYRYGFNEEAGNFQQYNFGRGGRENDGVIANAHDGSGYNNANFMTPPDGQNGRMRMYLWNTALPFRDGDLEAGIVIHELSHGLSIRLTGGPLNSNCLGWGESGGMGEGWGDFIATTIRSNKEYSDYAMGAWAANREDGIRNYIYSTNTTVNPSVYKTLDKPGYWGVHAIGEVWAEILWVVSQRLIEKHGYSESLFPPTPREDGTIPPGDFYRTAAAGKPLVPKHGNSLSIQLVLNGMKLQPCRPNFFQARDAIISADNVLTGGENFCILWNAFAERGLGSDAKIEGQTPWGGGIRTNGYAVPAACQVDDSA
ncbi:extracellular elastinolytic metallo proteinase [Coprinopsis marcescibilis]|uniref:Extracellular metalloproteinase n=1 Tax=Coprinopsis marcescibilis TaxID=230819 RepID=A0A5C3KQW2_COPMA|nr:extracellular elastinolytic metallo proteinase [Coprinopsis marcescibilis]